MEGKGNRVRVKFFMLKGIGFWGSKGKDWEGKTGVIFFVSLFFCPKVGENGEERHQD